MERSTSATVQLAPARSASARPSARRLTSLAEQPLRALAPLLPLYVVVTAITQPWGHLAGDEEAFLGYAHRILHGQYASPHTMDPGAFLWHGPGTPALLAPFVAAGVPLDAMRFLMAPLLFAAVVVFHRLLLVRLQPRAALVGALAFGLYLPFYQPLRGIHKEPIAILLVVAALLALSRHLDSGRAWQALAAGLALAGVVMVRVEYGWVVLALLVVCAAWWASSRRSAARRATAVMAIAALGCVPWLAYTYSLTHAPLYWGSSGGSSLYWMSPTGPGETGQWHADHTVFESDRFVRYRPFFSHLATLPTLERNAAMERAAKANIRAHPLQYARNIAANAARLWFLAPFWPRQPLGLLAMYWVFGAALIATSAWAALALMRRRRSLPPETLPIAAFAVIALAVHLPASADPRMTLPIVPALLWLVAQAAGPLLNRKLAQEAS